MSFVSDYASIKNGSYGKLLKAYYGGQSTSSSTSSTSDTSSTTDTTKKTQAISVRDAAADLKSSVNKLTDSSSDLFEKKDVTAKDGTKSKDYDVDSIYKAVKSFVSDYNDTIKAADSSTNSTVQTKTSSMESLTNTMKNVLGKIGISVSSSTNQLSIDEDAFKKADMSTVKSLFQGTGSYGYQIGSAASSMINSSNTQIAQLTGSLYTSSGNYSSGFYSGSFYSDYF
jgi:molecular chaperone GrpE (heat shock protein)